MRNILSYRPGTIFTGQEINLWLQKQITQHTSHEKIARRLFLRKSYKDNRLYELCRIVNDNGKIENYFIKY